MRWGLRGDGGWSPGPRIGDLTDDEQDLWWRFDATQPAEVAAAAQDMRGVWHRFGEPFLDLCADPATYPGWFVSTRRTGRPGFDLAFALDQHATAHTLATRDLAELRAVQPGEPSRATRTRRRTCSRPMPGQPTPLRRLGQPLPEADQNVPAELSNPRAPPNAPDNHWPPGATWSTSSPRTSAPTHCPDRGERRHQGQSRGRPQAWSTFPRAESAETWNAP